MTFEELRYFIASTMKMSHNQPLLIKSLIESGGEIKEALNGLEIKKLLKEEEG